MWLREEEAGTGRMDILAGHKCDFSPPTATSSGVAVQNDLGAPDDVEFL